LHLEYLNVHIFLGAGDVGTAVPLARTEVPAYRERGRRLEEDGDVEERMTRSHVDHYDEQPADFDHEPESGTSDDGERWFNEHAFNIHRATNNDIRKHISQSVKISVDAAPLGSYGRLMTIQHAQKSTS